MKDPSRKNMAPSFNDTHPSETSMPGVQPCEGRYTKALCLGMRI